MRFKSIDAFDQWLKESNRSISDVEVYTLHGPGSGTTTTIHVSSPGENDSVNVPHCSLSEDVDPSHVNDLMLEIDKEYPELTEDEKLSAAENASKSVELDSGFEGFPNKNSAQYTPTDSAKFLEFYAASLDGIRAEKREAARFNETIVVKSFSEPTKVWMRPLNECAVGGTVHNVWYVDDYESLEGACSTSKISYKDNTLLMNVCESEGRSTVNLIMEVDNKIHKIPFVLKKSCNNDTGYDMIFFL